MQCQPHHQVRNARCEKVSTQPEDPQRRPGGALVLLTGLIELSPHPAQLSPGPRSSHKLGTVGSSRKPTSRLLAAATAAHFDQFLPFDRSRGHSPMFGYNTGKVFKDARFRLGLYLREAGVAGSKAAHSAVMRAVGPTAEAPYAQTA